MMGEKIKRLELLRARGFRIPPFIAFSAQDMHLPAHELAQHARHALGEKSFAVRSSALCEDAEEKSMAGQFLTVLDVPYEDLPRAIDEVRADARKKLGALSEFSFFVQEFIPADISGVAFTRDPQGGRETVIEYTQGRGDKVVGGMVTPVREVFYRTQEEIVSKLPHAHEGREMFFAIEQIFGFPQDIEWCIAGDVWYVLQSRPITSCSQEQHDVYCELEEELPKKGKYFFEKTAVCDVAPRPSPETLQLLKSIYAQGGPVDRAYRTLGITYTDTDFLRTFCGELYVDREKEMQSLFPAHSHFFSSDYRARPVRIQGFFEGAKNARRFKHIKGDVFRAREYLAQQLFAPWDALPYADAVAEFLDAYETIFINNLFTERAVQVATQALPRGMNITQALHAMSGRFERALPIPSDLVGNTLDLSDASLFVTGLVKSIVLDDSTMNALHEAQAWLENREYGRWLAVRHISRIRRAMNVATHKEREAVRKNFPVVITDCPMPKKRNMPLGVSAGIAQGIVTRVPAQGGILIVSELTPELAKYSLSGVIADHGGILSHFAIIAREMKIPVIVQYPVHTLRDGCEVVMDGATGEVRIVGAE